MSESKFKWYIMHTCSRDVKGTNSDEVAEEFSRSDSFFVVNAETGHQFYRGELFLIDEVK